MALHPLGLFWSDQETAASKIVSTRSTPGSGTRASWASTWSRHLASRCWRYATTSASLEPNRSYSVFLVTPAAAAIVSTPTEWMLRS